MQASYVKEYEEWSKDFSYYREIQVRFGETDLFGHMNNAVAFVYFEEARTNFFEKVGFMDTFMSKEYEGMVVTADLQCDFIQQVYYGDVLKIFVKVAHIGNASMDIHYKVMNQKEELCFIGRGTMVQVSKRTGKAFSWSDDWKKRLQESVV